MKKTTITMLLSLFVLAAVLLGFTACSDMMEKLGNISLTIVLDTPDVQVASYSLEGLHNTPNTRFSISDITPPRHSLSSLKKGTWEITVTAFNADGDQIGAGTSRVDLKEGQIAETTLLVVFNQAVPAANSFTFAAPTRFDSFDGILSGTTANMEYRLASEPEDTPYTACTEGTTILGTGTYLLRYAAAHGLRASEPLRVTVPQYQPIQLTIADPTLTTGKVYDGTTEVSGTVTLGALSGVRETDTVTVSARTTYDDKSSGSGKTITLTYTLGGPDAGNYIKPVDKTMTGSIEKKPLTVSGTTITNSKVYDRSPLIEPTSLGSLGGVLGTDEVTVTSTTASCSDSNVGNDKPVTITYTLGGRDSGNYQLADNHSEQTSITKAVLTATVGDYAKTYGENNPSYAVSVSGFVPGDDANTAAGYIAPSASSITDATTGIGTYPIAITGGSATNYSFVTSDRGNLTINKATMAGSVSISGTTAYGQVLTAVPSLTKTETPTYQWKRNGTAISGATGTTYTLVTEDIGSTITVTATASGANYQGTKDSAATATVAKATYAMGGITFGSYAIPYDGNPKSILISGTLPSGVSVSYSGNVQTNAGAYTATARFTGDSTNYNTITEKTAKLTINKAIMTGSISITGTATYGQVLTAVPNLTKTETPTYQWKRNGTAISGATGTTYTLVTEDIESTITVTATASGANYQGTKDSAATATVTKATYAMGSIGFSDSSVTYDGNPQSILISGTLPSGVSVSYSGNVQTNAGAYDATARFTGDSTNYNTITEKTAKLTINKAIMTGSISITGTATYGQVLTAVPNLTKTETPTYQWKRNGTAISGATGTTYTLVTEDIESTITVTATASGANYQGTKDSAATATVTKATYAMGSIGFSDSSVTYDGNPQSILISGTLPSGVSVSYSGNVQTNAGAYDATARFTGDSTNYNTITEKTAKLTINKAIMTGSISITGTATYGQVLTAVPNLTNAGTPTYQWKRNGIAISGATGTTYTLVTADIGATISITAFAEETNYQGSLAGPAIGPIQKPAGPAISDTIMGYIPASPASQTVINVTGFSTNLTNLEAAVAINGSTFSSYVDIAVDSRNRAMIVPTTTVTTATKVRIRVKETDILAAGPVKEIALTSQALAIGDYYQGGIVAYFFVSGDPGYIAGQVHGLIAATNDVSSTGVAWSNSTTTIVGTSSGIGTGLNNTNQIVTSIGSSASSYAAGMTRNYRGGGYSDWFLPSKDELYKMRSVFVTIGNFASPASFYWSSTEEKAWSREETAYTGDTVHAIEFNPNSGNSILVSNSPKTYAYFVRPVRNF